MDLTTKRALFALIICCVLALATVGVLGIDGAQITFNSTDDGPSLAADAHTANRSTITTLILDAIQLDQNWKGYVGNVSASLTLDDSSNNTLYDWDLSSTTGKIVATRHSSMAFGTVTCAEPANVVSEDTFFNMTATQVDSITNSLNQTNHSSFQVGTTVIPEASCNATALYESDTEMTLNTSANFQEVMLEDANNKIFFLAILNDDTTGFDGATYDFQMIVPESDVNSTLTPYYFYAEIDS